MASFERMSMGQRGFLRAQTGGFSNFAIDQSGDKLEWIFQASEAATITHVGARYAARTGTPPAHKAGLQGVSAGVPDGTYLGGGSPASVVFTPPADATWDGTWRWLALDNSIALTRGQLLSMVIEYSSGTVDGSNNSSWTNRNSLECDRMGFPYGIQNNNGSRSRLPDGPVFGLKSASKTYLWPMETDTNTDVNSNSSPNEYATAFQFDAGWGDSFRVLGARFHCGRASALTTRSFEMNLYEGTTVIQGPLTWSTANVTANDQNRFLILYFTDATLAALKFGTTYRLALKPLETNTNLGMRIIGANVEQDASAWPGGGKFWLSTRAGGAWTDDTTKRLMLTPIIDDWREPTEASVQIGVL